MTRRIVIEQSAKADLAEAVRWYKRAQPGLQADYRLCVRASLHRIARLPESYPIVEQDVRRALTDRFPFAIYFRLDEEIVRVFGVLHTSRDPVLWQSRNH